MGQLVGRLLSWYSVGWSVSCQSVGPFAFGQSVGGWINGSVSQLVGRQVGWSSVSQ